MKKQVVESVKELEEGVYINGMYNGMQEFSNNDGSKSLRVNVLSGDTVHRVYIETEDVHHFYEHDTKEDVLICARPVVNKKGFLNWYGGRVVRWFDEDEAQIPAAS